MPIQKTLSRVFFPLVFLCFICCLFAGALYLAVHVQSDYFDGFNFLLQAQSHAAYDGDRPRLLVICLNLFNRVFKLFQGELPGLAATHCLMVVISFLFFLVWTKIICRFIGKTEAMLFGIFLVIPDFFTRNSFVTLTDMLSGLALGIFTWFILQTPTLKNAVIVGIFGSFLALSKHHFLLVFPFWALLNILKRPPRWTLLSSFVFFPVTDLLIRFFGDWKIGLIRLLIGIGEQAERTYFEAESVGVYLKGLLTGYGIVFWILSLSTLFLSRPVLWDSIKKMGAESRSLAAILTAILLMLQLYPHRETRYLLPFLPGILLPLVICIPRLYLKQCAGWKVFYGVLWVMAICPAFYNTVRCVRGYTNDTAQYWSYLKDLKCHELAAISQGIDDSEGSGFPKDPYYRKKAFAPSYTYFLGIRAKWYDDATTLEDLQQKHPTADCFVIAKKNTVLVFSKQKSRSFTFPFWEM